MPMDRMTWQVAGPIGKIVPSSVARVTVLLFALCCKSMQSLGVPGYVLTAPATVSVQRGLCVSIPCNFTYNEQHHTSSGQLRGYWFKYTTTEQYYTRPYSSKQHGLLVATNDDNGIIDTSAWKRFKLTGDPAQGSCSFSISDAQQNDQGRYFFRIVAGGRLKYNYQENPDGTSAFLRVDVTELTEKPVILNSSEVVRGRPVTFTCWAWGVCPGPPEPIISWIREGTYSQIQGSPESNRHSNGSQMYGSSITFTPSSTDQGKVLTCHVTYRADRTGRNSIHLDIAYPPSDVEIAVEVTSPGGQPGSSSRIVGGDLASVMTREGDKVSLICQTDGKPDPTLIWTKENRNLSNPKQGRKYTHLLTLVREEDAGEYRCRAENPHGSANKTFRLVVQYPPRNVTQAYMREPALSQDPPRTVANGSQLTAWEGGTLRLYCKADSNPPLNSTHWAKGGKTWEKQGQDSWLELSNLRVEDEGEYTCQLQNSLGSAHGTFLLVIAYAPKRSRNPQTHTTCQHEDNRLLCTCSLHSRPPPQIYWQVMGEDISENMTKGSLRVTSRVQGDEVTSTLIWTGSLDGDHSIICLGNNSIGIYTMHFLLSSLKTDHYKTLLISGLCGALLAAGVILLVLCLIKFYKKRKASPKAGSTEAAEAVNGIHQRVHNPSQIYSNIPPVIPRTPQVGKPKAAGERNAKPDHRSRVPNPNTDDPEDVHYAALEFKQKNKATPEVESPEVESVEYSEIKRK
ncbi:sialic acid-binding Ig-like lectin 16 isoform X1 [Hemicordylus capensis]|uniref:sialic acid-binding Ig-like lectin 16 isoform X1 n=1 Tax=Hemicordylus capensis TaxID=884348 RepID=UPI0023040ABF|nr:sialic acid-binding Ig-like lectin 16 isoform X1 [Hemicordylus capensis]XP_053123436.1 sialic acid-binding Ig-like lectin 16 isoform X1 [Hemicordylus capensis]XP_053123437.1 sialic acid-binding Ig-like lectin 16 isoform X1 [Hemicordylus capensis]XP_053123438.1 sialic acid-binding Ig-like lectin 16 isoform X1 [Hemicordylus capensis]